MKNINTNNLNTRPGCMDMWNAFMVEGSIFSPNDIPHCPTTAHDPPRALISYDAAKSIHKKEMRKGNKNYHIDAFIHFYIDDQKFDGKRSSIWLFPTKLTEVLCHFSGMICPDFSTYADFPEPLKLWNFYRMNAMGFWIGKQGYPVISNARWGTEETWKYCFDGNPTNSMIAIGTVASGINLRKNRPLFEAGLFRMVDTLTPHTIIVYGSSNYPCFEKLKKRGIKIISFPSQTNEFFSGRDKS